MFIVNFNDDAYLDQPFTNSIQKLEQALEKITDKDAAWAAKARATATPFTARLRHAVGLRPLDQVAEVRKTKGAKAAGPVFKQYRESDGRFHFKLTDAKGTVLLQSRGFEAPRDAAQAMARIQAEGLAAVVALQDRLEPSPDPAALASALDALATPAG